MLYLRPRLGSLLRDLNRTSFRKHASTLTRRGMIGLATAAALFATPAFSQQFSRATQELTNRVFSDPAITTTTNCDNYMPNEYGASALCSVRKGQLLEQRGRDLSAREKQLDRESAQLEDLLACKKFLTDGVANNTIVHADMMKAAGGKVDRNNVCDVARSLGFARKAGLVIPAN
jgi:hypothetical protein